MSVDDCPARHYVVADLRGSSQDGWGCLANGGHCIPGDYCASRVKKFKDAVKLRMEWESIQEELK